MPTNLLLLLRRPPVLLLLFVLLVLTGFALAQGQLLKVKGGHDLGETAAQFFAEGYEKQMLGACASGDFKSVEKSSRRELRKYCAGLDDSRRQAAGGKRYDYKGGGDLTEMRTDTFTFDGGRLVKVELIYSAPNAEVNYRGQKFDDIFAGVKQAYGPPTSETTQPAKNAYGVEYVAHREFWLLPGNAILITERPGADGSTTLEAFTRAEYDRTRAAAGKPANPLE